MSLDRFGGRTRSSRCLLWKWLRRKKLCEQHGEHLKPGIDANSADQVKVNELLRPNTPKSRDEQISWKMDVDRKEERENDSSCSTCESIAVVSFSPFLENLRRRSPGVFFMVHPVDEYAVQQLKESDGKKLKCTTKEKLDIGDEDEEKLEDLKTEFKPWAKLTTDVEKDLAEAQTEKDCEEFMSPECWGEKVGEMTLAVTDGAVEMRVMTKEAPGFTLTTRRIPLRISTNELNA